MRKITKRIGLSVLSLALLLGVFKGSDILNINHKNPLEVELSSTDGVDPPPA